MKGLSEIEVLNSRISQDLFEFISSLQMNQARHRREVLALLEKLPEDHKLYGKTLVKFFTDKFHNDVGTHLHHVRNMTGEITCLTYKLKGDMETFTSTLTQLKQEESVPLYPVIITPMVQDPSPAAPPAAASAFPACVPTYTTLQAVPNLSHLSHPSYYTTPEALEREEDKYSDISSTIAIAASIADIPMEQDLEQNLQDLEKQELQQGEPSVGGVGGVGVEAVAGEEHIIETSSPVSPDAVGAPTSTDTAEALAPAPEAAEPPPPGVEIELSSDNSSSSSTGAEPDQEYQVNYSRAG